MAKLKFPGLTPPNPLVGLPKPVDPVAAINGEIAAIGEAMAAADERIAAPRGLSAAVSRQKRSVQDLRQADYYSVVWFHSEAQRNAFASAVYGMAIDAGLPSEGLQLRRYCEGEVLAKLLGIELPPAPKDPPRPFKVSKRLSALSRKI